MNVHIGRHKLNFEVFKLRNLYSKKSRLLKAQLDGNWHVMFHQVRFSYRRTLPLNGARQNMIIVQIEFELDSVIQVATRELFVDLTGRYDSSFGIISCVVTIYNREIESHCPQCKAGEPVGTAWTWIDLNKRPPHGFCSLALLPPIPNHTKLNVRATKPLLDPLEALEFPHIPRTVHWRQGSVISTQLNVCQ